LERRSLAISGINFGKLAGREWKVEEDGAGVMIQGPYQNYALVKRENSVMMNGRR
jgi:hypothetical protein